MFVHKIILHIIGYILHAQSLGTLHETANPEDFRGLTPLAFMTNYSKLFSFSSSRNQTVSEMG